ncbi:HAD family hydrolase [Nitratidesulfovibrio vulgaris]|uniref:HAD family hydrolase n=1 Tax=Nitratidesulfovibrio vulgaris TaxID=881 RepID=UPI002301D939|nr:HAD family hydrolase [Nitratidesulfovibrio vulgaris]WCB47017.1 HAD hydrolase-like protein [Nitratidesulfovibrio vulgaris]
MPLSCIVFDCDGVILESVNVKTEAFARVAEPFGCDVRDRLVAYHIENGGVSRYKKFEWMFREVLGREISSDELNELGRRYAEYAFEGVLNAQLVPGAYDAITAWHGRVPMYVCSGAPHEELTHILHERGLSRFFAGIYGSPPGKSELLAKVVKLADVAPATTVMIGDSKTDLRAAEDVGTLFYGRGEAFAGGTHPWGDDLTGLSAWLETLAAD